MISPQPKPAPRQKAAKAPLKRSRPRKRRRGRPAILAREADRLWGLVVRARGECEAGCGRRESLQAAHGWSRRYRATRWLTINGFCLCRNCHVFFTHRPLEWDDYLRIAWGSGMYESLRAMAVAGKKPDLEAITESLRCELFKLEGLPALEERGLMVADE